MTTRQESLLPVFMRDAVVRDILHDVIAAIPKGQRIYLVGGAARNAFYERTHHERLPQRDYDLVVIGSFRPFIRSLRAYGFTYGKIRRAHQVVLKHAKVSEPSAPSDFVVLDIAEVQETNIRSILRRKVNFTINGFAIPLRALTTAQWHTRAVMLPSALPDLKAKHLRVNSTIDTAILYACVRFMSQGFSPPDPHTVRELLHRLTHIEERRFERNRKKVFSYVGGERAARQLMRKLGVKDDVFDFAVLRKLRARAGARELVARP